MVGAPLGLGRALAPASAAKSVIVVGAGAAGLAAARVLHGAGVAVTVLEASERVGGRCLTTEVPGCGAAELGANWLHGTRGNPAYDLAKANGLLKPIGEPPRRRNRKHVVLTEDGEEADAGTVAATKRVFFSTVNACSEGVSRAAMQGLSSRSVGEYCRRALEAARPRLRATHRDAALIDASFEWAARMQCSIDGCGDLDEQGLEAYANYEELSGGNLPSFAPGGGFSAIMDVLARGLAKD
eukprot:3393026-Prymnesium_polylepis.1